MKDVLELLPTTINHNAAELLHLIFGILRSGKPFNPNHPNEPKTA